MTEPLKILTVCSHNRTRSVMTMAMLQRKTMCEQATRLIAGVVDPPPERNRFDFD